MKKHILTRFCDKVRLAESGCWEWQGAMTAPENGYGVFYLDRERGRRLTHRFAYETFIGPIPGGRDLDHLCRNRRCANPDHLEPVTRRENVVRGASPNGVNFRKTHCIRGHELTQENCYATKWPWNRECKLCARIVSKEKAARRRIQRGAPR